MNITLPYLETCITTACNRHCSKCTALMPYYRGEGRHEDAKTTLGDFEHIFRVIDRVDVYKLLGGEPFLHPDLPAFVERLIREPKVGRIIINTNGEVLPAENVYDTIDHPKVHVLISGYRPNPPLRGQLAIRRINYRHWTSQTWWDLGPIDQLRERSESETAEMYRACLPTRCNNLSFGEFHVCPRTVHGMRLGLIPRDENSYANLRGLSVEESKQAIARVLSVPFLNACLYCDGQVKNAAVVPAGT